MRILNIVGIKNYAEWGSSVAGITGGSKIRLIKRAPPCGMLPNEPRGRTRYSLHDKDTHQATVELDRRRWLAAPRHAWTHPQAFPHLMCFDRNLSTPE